MQQTDALIKATQFYSIKEAGFFTRNAPKAKMFLKGLGSGFSNVGKGVAGHRVDQLEEMRNIIGQATPRVSQYGSGGTNAKELAKQLMPAYRLGQSSAVPGALAGSGLVTGGLIGSTYGDTKGQKRMGRIAENVPLLERLRYIVDPDFLNDYITGRKPLPY
jgi:hypothetical protein